MMTSGKSHAHTQTSIFLGARRLDISELESIFNIHRQQPLSWQSMSSVNPVIHTRYKNDEFIIKVIPKVNIASTVQTSYKSLTTHRSWADALKQSNTSLIMPEILEIQEWDEYFSILLPYLNLTSLSPNIDVSRLVHAAKTFHTNTHSHAGIFDLPWNCFSPAFQAALKRSGRWDAILFFLGSYQPDDHMNNVVCHNDLHSGNVFENDNTICIVDLCESALASPLNDLGILLVNYTRMEDMKADNILRHTEGLLSMYDLEPTPSAICDVLLYGIRKLFIIEGYYTYCALTYGHKNSKLLRRLRHQQDSLISSLEFTYD